MYLQPPSRCAFVSGDCHFVHARDGLCFLLYLWMCTPHATSKESLLARKDGMEHGLWRVVLPCIRGAQRMHRAMRFLYDRAQKIAYSGSWDMYSLARSERVI